MKYCKRCLFPDTKPDLYFDEQGVCDACRSAEKKHRVETGIDWEERKREFNEIIEKHRSKNGSKYDCLVPVSGGKDSTFQAYVMKVIHKMNPLAVTFDQFDSTETSKHNLEILRKIGVDHIHFTMNPNIIKKLVKKGFEIVGDPYWVNHVGIFTIPAKIAVAFNIPLIIWGENSQLEYGGPATEKDRKVLDKRWRQEFGGMRGFREEDMVDDEITLSDLKALVYPSDEEIKRVGVTGLFYGYFFKWDTSKNVELAKQLGWKPLPKPWAGSWLDYENCDMKFEGIREHLKWVKYGFGRATDQVNIYIRNNQLTREEALAIVKERDGKLEFKKEFCDYIGITEQEFDRTRDSFVNKDIFKRGENGEWVLKEPLSNSDKTEQAQKWANEFGNEYINRNPKNIQDLDNLYMKNFGITRTSLNEEFLSDLPKYIKILEVGCSVGAQLTGLQELGFEDLTGIEISKKAIEQAKQNTKNINFLNASALDLPFKDNSFDLVFTAGVLIHIHPGDLNKVIDEIYRTSKKYIWGWEYFSEECQEIEYRGNKNMLWKNNFMQLFLDRHQDLKIIKQKKVEYLDSKNQDHMFLLEKFNNTDKD